MYPKDKFGIYIHFPFCLRKCRYCSFYSEDIRLDRIDNWTHALCSELILRSEQLRSNNSKDYTLYIGGGSPNLIGENNLRSITDTLFSILRREQNLEITVEINPGSVSPELLDCFQSVGVTRLSIGCQSFISTELELLGRIHNVRDIWDTIKAVRNRGFQSINLDLIYGIPNQTLETWRKSLEDAVSADTEHLSLYNLSYDRGTALYKMKADGKIHAHKEETELRMYQIAHNYLNEADYQHYEVSNWAKTGYSSLHNSLYWGGAPYYGFGPAAHSYDSGHRWWNVSNIDKYIDLLNQEILPVQHEEELSETERRVEYLLLGLRTEKGIDTSKFSTVMKLDFDEVYLSLSDIIGEKETLELCYIEDKFFKLSNKGWFVIDSIIDKILAIVERISHDN